MNNDNSGYSLLGNAANSLLGGSNTGSGGTGNKINWGKLGSKAAGLFGKYGSLLGIPLQLMGANRSNRAIDEEIKRLQGITPDTVDYGTITAETYKPETMDPTQALKEADQVAATNAYNVGQLGAGNLGSMLAHAGAQNIQALKNKADIRTKWDNINKDILNKAGIENATIKNEINRFNQLNRMKSMEDTAKNFANYQNQLFALKHARDLNKSGLFNTAAQSIAGTAQNVGGNRILLNTMGQLFSNPETLKMISGMFGGGNKTT
jgi:hypothetical protein